MRRRPNLPLAALAALLAALALRLLLWGSLPRAGLISDEGEYLSAAQWLAEGRGFDWYQAYLWTRAPLYPLLVAAHLRLFGPDTAALFATQTALSLLNTALVLLLARALAPAQRALAPLAALLAGLYLPLALYAQVVLSETLFITLLLAAMLALARAGISPRRAALAGALLGLAALTRGMALGFIPLVALWLLLQRGPSWRAGAQRAAALALAAAITIGPWSLYSSRTFGGLVPIDTSGAFNLLLGARTAYDGKRSDAAVRDFALALLGQPTSAPLGATCAPFPGAQATQAARQAAQSAEGLCLLRASPGAFARKSLAELVDMLQINYTGAERFTDGFSTGRHDPLYILALFLLDDTLYVLALPLAVVGWALARARLPGSPLVPLAGLWWLYNLAVAPLLFAINRFRVPLMPLALLFAAYALVCLAARLRGQPAPAAGGRLVWAGAALAALLATLAASPYAYLEPRPPGADSRWASYLGPYPSSLDITMKALAARPRHLGDQQFAQAIADGDLARAEAALRGPIGLDTARLGPAILAARAGRPQEALALLPPADASDGLALALRGDALRTLGDEAGALAALSARPVDDINPVAWAWQWLSPAPATTINLGGSLDLGYISGCFLGEGDSIDGAPANFRWCTDGAQLRFPGAATAQPQQLALRIDSRAWAGYAASPPPIRVQLGGVTIGAIQPAPASVAIYSVPIPPLRPGADIVITLRTATFVPDAARYNSQQGRAVVGQVQRLGARIDWAELRGGTP